ncbi:hypothetical protein ACLB2K_041118 [Fragaria x ananassa]
MMKPIKVPEPFDLRKSTNSEYKNHDEKEKYSTCRDDEKQNKVIFDLTKSESYVQKHSTCKNDEKENVNEIIDLDNSKSYQETDKDVDDEVILDYVYNGGLNGLILAECNGIQCNRNGARTLMPHQWLDDEVVNIYTSYLNASSGSDSVYVTTYFSGKLGNYHRDFALSGKRPTQKEMWILVYAPHIRVCKKIFIPIHDTNHWYLFVVRIDNETGEYWDSLGNSAARRSNCKNILKVLDIYFGHMVTKTKKFEDFPIFKPPNCP